MAVSNWIIVISWLIFLIYWGVSAIGVKKDIRRLSGHYVIRLAAAAIIILIIILKPASVERFLNRFLNYSWTSPDSVLKSIGAIICALGIALAIWARWHLGKNWSPRPSVKENHELITSGPYRFVRHPIYTGMLAALFGSALAGSFFWLIVFVAAAAVFINRVHIEERLMEQQFPAKYAEYKKRTKALIPFVW
ncbi:MAG: isoprenylcysteine carboxylmethyltransferase family protein [Patescibacteria group bacterium]|nr:isoprenylcysteine carboxylmethyltransferase family protein [Patescibacteria group bacterium]